MNGLASYLPAGSGSRLIAGLVALAIAYTVGLAVYRLAFSQLAGFPGPKIAAATGWYEFYHDCWRNGKYIFEIERMHQKYGVRPLKMTKPHVKIGILVSD